MKPSVSECLSQDTVAASESLSAMMQKEQSTYLCGDYLRPPVPDATLVTELDRLKIVDWCYGVVDHCKFDRETVAIAMDMVDRFLSRSQDDEVAYRAMRDRRQFQLLAMAALYVAIKTNEKVSVGSNFFAAMSHGVYSAKDIEAMELALLEGLSWRICGPTTVQMSYHVLSLVKPQVSLQESVWCHILDEVRFRAEHALRDYSFVTSRRSTVAMAAIFISLDQVGQQDRRAILRALLLVLNDQFDSAKILLAARNRLHSLVEGDAGSLETPIVSASSSEVEAIVLNRGCGHSLDEQRVFTEESSPRSVCEKCVRS